MVLTYLDELRGRDLDEVNLVHSASSVQEWTTEELPLHMVEEELQHRGELNCLLGQIGYDPPILGFHRWHKAKRKET